MAFTIKPHNTMIAVEELRDAAGNLIARRVGEVPVKVEAEMSTAQMVRDTLWLANDGKIAKERAEKWRELRARLNPKPTQK